MIFRRGVAAVAVVLVLLTIGGCQAQKAGNRDTHIPQPSSGN